MLTHSRLRLCTGDWYRSLYGTGEDDEASCEDDSGEKEYEPALQPLTSRQGDSGDVVGLYRVESSSEHDDADDEYDEDEGSRAGRGGVRECEAEGG